MNKSTLSVAVLAALCFFTGTLSAQQSPTGVTPQCLFRSPDAKGIPYRIPAIVTNRQGVLLAFSDYRYCGADIGYGKIDIVMRSSSDNGKTWTPEKTVVAGSGDADLMTCGYGDAAVVADRKSNRVLMMCCSGKIPYWQSTNAKPQRMVRLYSDDGGQTWGRPEDITEQLYGLFRGLQGKQMDRQFVGSGKICQSKRIKTGSHYRIYAALCTGIGNYVIYSDDLGQKWSVLGGIEASSPAPKGDEPKCEELPDGSVLLSSRKSGGRFFNIYSYTDRKTGTGQWHTPVASDECPGGIQVGRNSTNGEVALLDVYRTADNKKMQLLIQSLPAGDDRSRVSIFYKGISSAADYVTPKILASNWEGSFEVTPKPSAYSTFCLQTDKRLGFFYEEEPGGYSLIYTPIDIATLTQGAYRIR